MEVFFDVAHFLIAIYFASLQSSHPSVSWVIFEVNAARDPRFFAPLVVFLIKLKPLASFFNANLSVDSLFCT